MRKILFAFISLFIMAAVFAAPAYSGWSPFKKEKAQDQKVRDKEVAEAIARFKNSDPDMKVFFEKAYGYAVFPSVGKGGMGIGGAYGKGKVYKNKRPIGRSSLKQLTIGFQLGGQVYSEIIFFKDKKALDDFKSGNFELGAQASAVAVTAGASANADYDNGVAIFTIAKGGLMYEATVGGQKFSFTPM
ncbi:MAG: YSC84-related protein [Thermodesulfobacteriota bacterium]